MMKEMTVGKPDAAITRYGDDMTSLPVPVRKPAGRSPGAARGPVRGHAATEQQGASMMTEHGTLPAHIGIAQARLPESYETAKAALATCANIDECRSWANKAEALASYAKQAEDEELFEYARRVRARAIQRAGELLKQLDARGDHMKKDTADLSRSEAARDAGISERQRKQAIRIANIPADQFERLVESDNPPTVTQLAEIGKKTRAATDRFGVTVPDDRAGHRADRRTETNKAMEAAPQDWRPPAGVSYLSPEQKRQHRIVAVELILQSAIGWCAHLDTIADISDLLPRPRASKAADEIREAIGHLQSVIQRLEKNPR